jgi:hypothetical protein
MTINSNQHMHVRAFHNPTLEWEVEQSRGTETGSSTGTCMHTLTLTLTLCIRDAGHMHVRQHVQFLKNTN